MNNLLELMLIYITFLFFSPNNILSIIYTIVTALVYVLYLVCYRRNGTVKDVRKINFDMCFFLVLIMIVSVNLIVKLEFINVIYGIVISLIYLIFVIKFMILKKDIRSVKIIKPDLFFDLYSILYFCGLVSEVITNEF